jgi:CMP-N-acetylneuraminic acid synthetase
MSKMTDHRTVAFIFARGGSTGIPQKNLQMIGDLSLIARSIKTALEVEEISEVIVSTDDEEIAEEARLHGAITPFVRPPELASNQASEWDAWQHAVGHPSIGDFDAFISVPPTAPLRISEDLACCLRTYQESCADIVVTGTESARSPYFNLVRKKADGWVDVFEKLGDGVTRRQDAPPTYDLTTVAYVSSPQHILKASGVFDGRVGMVCVPRLRALDIDDPIDLETAQFYFNNPEFLKGESYRAV